MKDTATSETWFKTIARKYLEAQLFHTFYAYSYFSFEALRKPASLKSTMCAPLHWA